MSPVRSSEWPAWRLCKTRLRTFSLPYGPTSVAGPPATQAELAYRGL